MPTQTELNQLDIKNNKKKISFLSAILFVTGSSIGAGIFLKDGEIIKYAHGSIVLAIASWLIAFVGILAMAFALLEVLSAKSSNNEGIVDWTKTFTNNYIYKGCRRFMSWIYLPITLLTMPYYCIQTFCDAIYPSAPWYFVTLLSLALVCYFAFTARYIKLVEKQNIITSIVKFFPLIFAALIGFIYIGINHKTGGGNTWNTNSTVPDDAHKFSNLNTYLGLFLAIPSILFVFDGFFSATVVQNDMRQPKKFGKALVIGLISLVVIDLIIAISLLLGPNTTADGGMSIFANWIPDWLFKVIQILIAIGIMGIINTFTTHSYKTYKAICKEKGVKKYELWGAIWTFIIIFAVFVIGTLIGYFYLNEYGDQYSKHLGNIYSFIDLSSNWIALFAFLIISFSIIGAMVNRKKKKIEITKVKAFWPSSIICILIFFTSALFVLISTFVDLGFCIEDCIKNGNVDDLWSQLLSVIVLLSFIYVMFISPLHIKRANSK